MKQLRQKKSAKLLRRRNEKSLVSARCKRRLQTAKQRSTRCVLNVRSRRVSVRSAARSNSPEKRPWKWLPNLRLLASDNLWSVRP